MGRIEKVFLLALFSCSLLPLLWFPNKTILLGYDNVYPLHPTAFLADRFHSWSSLLGFGSDQSGIQGSLIIHFIDALPQFLGFSYQTSQKIVTVFWFFLLIFSPYKLVRTLEKYGFTKSKYLWFFFPALYAINFYTLQAWWIFERTKFSLLVATPLILSLIIPMAKDRMSFWYVLRKAVLCSLILSIFNGGGWLGLSLYGGLIVVLVCFYIFYSLFFFIEKQFRSTVYLNVFFLIFFLHFFLLNAYTILPFLFTTLPEYGSLLDRSGGIGGIIGWARYLSAHTSFINLLRLQGIPDWYNTPYHPYGGVYLQNIFFLAVSFFFPLAIFLAQRYSPKGNRFISVFFLFLLIVSLFFTAGMNGQTWYIFEFFLRHIPGFIIFKSAIFKFGYAYWFAAGFFVALFLSSFIEFIEKIVMTRKLSLARFSNVLLPLLLLVLIIAYHFPYITGDFFRVDNTSVTSRVAVPSYIPQFATWWEKNGKNEKILLLPQLNSDWYFEIYRWKYLSLNPVLANFGSTGIVENYILNRPSEMQLVNKLYKAINEEDHDQVDMLTNILGIRYFLLRKDFFHDVAERQTDSPRNIEQKLSRSNTIEHVKTFGEWIVYRYTTPKPQMYTTNTAAGSYEANGSVPTILTEPLHIYLTKEASQPSLAKITTNATCISCQGERQTTSIEFPRPRILLGSRLYELVRLRERLFAKKPASLDDNLFSLVGKSLKYAGQISELINHDKGDYLVSIAREKYVETLNELSAEIPLISSQSSALYLTTIMLEQYLKSENEFVSDIIERTARKEQRVNLEKVLYAINIAEDSLKQIYNQDFFNRQKAYRVTIPLSGNYAIRIPKKSLGSILDSNYSKISLSLDSTGGVLQARNDGDFLSFGNHFMKKGKSTLILYLPDQENILSSPTRQRLAGRVCYIHFINNYEKDKIYTLEFLQRNNFDPSMLFFVDDAATYEPKILEYFSVLGEQVKERRYILSRETVPVSKIARTLRIGFCSQSMTEERLRENIRDLTVVELTQPEIILSQELSNLITHEPILSVKKSSSIGYTVSIAEAKSPYYLVFTTRYSPAWKSSVGEHLVGNFFNNTWYIDKKGNYDIDLSYQPQDNFYLGAAITGVFLPLSLLLLMKKRK